MDKKSYQAFYTGMPEAFALYAATTASKARYQAKLALDEVYAADVPFSDIDIYRRPEWDRYVGCPAENQSLGEWLRTKGLISNE